MKSIFKSAGILVFALFSVIIIMSSCEANGHKHTIVKTDRVEPCLKPGYTAGEYCTTCNDYKVGMEEIPPIGHHISMDVEETPATCGTSGLTAGKICSVCEEVLEGRDRIPPTRRHQCKAPTWLWNTDYKGVAAVFECVICKTTSTTRITDIKISEDDEGVKSYTASVTFAGMTYTDTQKVYPEGYVHTHKVVEVDKIEPTCVTPGCEAGWYCSACDHREGFEEIPATGVHTPVDLGGTPATCGKPGFTEGAECSVCGEVLRGKEPIPPTGQHTPVVLAETPATCGTPGITAGSECSVCGEVLEGRETIQPTGEHTPEEFEEIPATCENPGVTAGTECSVCGEVLEGREPIKQIPHQCKAPEWTWESDHGKAQAVFECVHCEQNAVVTTTSIEKLELDDGSVVYKATVYFAGISYTDEKKVYPTE